MGDFNYPQIDYASENVAAKPTDQPTLKHLYQHVRDATRIRQNHTPTTLDYVFTEEENLIELTNYEAPLGNSDHVVLTWKLLLSTTTISSSQVKFNFQKEEYESLRNSLRLIDWKERWNGKAVDEMWSDFTKILYEFVKMHIPLIHLKGKERKRDYLSRYGEKLAKEVARGRSIAGIGQAKTLTNTSS